MTGPTSSNQRPVSSNNSRVFRRVFRVIARLVSDLPAFLAASATDYDNGPSARVPQENTSDHASSNKRERDSDSESENDASPHIPKRRRVEQPYSSNPAATSSSSQPSTSRRRISLSSSISHSHRSQRSSQVAGRQTAEGQDHRPLRRSGAFTENQPWTFEEAGVRIDPSGLAAHEGDTSDSDSESESSPSPEPLSSGTPPPPAYSRNPGSGDRTVATGPAVAPSSASATPTSTPREPPPPYSPGPISRSDNPVAGPSSVPTTPSTPTHSQRRPTNISDTRSSANQPVAGSSSSSAIRLVTHNRVPRPRVNAFGATIYDDPDLMDHAASSDPEDSEMGDEDNNVAGSRALSAIVQRRHSLRRTPTRDLRRRDFTARYTLLHEEVERQAKARHLESERRDLLTPPLLVPDPRRQQESARIDATASRKRSRAHAIGDDVDAEGSRPTTRRKHAHAPAKSSPLAPTEAETAEREESNPRRVPHLSSAEGSRSALRRRSSRNTESQSHSSRGSSTVAARREESNPARVPPSSPAEGSSRTATRRLGRNEESSSSRGSLSSPSPKKKSRQH